MTILREFSKINLWKEIFEQMAKQGISLISFSPMSIVTSLMQETFVKVHNHLNIEGSCSMIMSITGQTQDKLKRIGDSLIESHQASKEVSFNLDIESFDFNSIPVTVGASIEEESIIPKTTITLSANKLTGSSYDEKALKKGQKTEILVQRFSKLGSLAQLGEKNHFVRYKGTLYVKSEPFTKGCFNYAYHRT